MMTTQLFTQQLYTQQLYIQQLYIQQLYIQQLPSSSLYTGDLCWMLPLIDQHFNVPGHRSAGDVIHSLQRCIQQQEQQSAAADTGRGRVFLEETLATLNR